MGNQVTMALAQFWSETRLPKGSGPVKSDLILWICHGVYCFVLFLPAVNMVALDADITENEQKCEVPPANHAKFISIFLLLLTLKCRLAVDIEVLNLG